MLNGKILLQNPALKFTLMVFKVFIFATIFEKSVIVVQLGTEFVNEKAIAHDLHNFHSHQTIQSTLVPYMEAFVCRMFTFLSPSVCTGLFFRILTFLPAYECSRSKLLNHVPSQGSPYHLRIKLIFRVGKPKITKKGKYN